MDSLNLPSILSPDLGLLFWMLIAFLVVFGLLAKFGFPVITSMVEERKKFIDESLTNARVTNEKLATLKAESEKILKEAHEQQAAILREAKTTGDKIIADASTKLDCKTAEARIEAKAREIEQSKLSAVTENKTITFATPVSGDYHVKTVILDENLTPLCTLKKN